MCIGGRPLCNVRVADGISLLGNSEEELQQLTESLEKTVARCGMEIGSHKRKVQQHRAKVLIMDEWKSAKYEVAAQFASAAFHAKMKHQQIK